MEYSRIDRRQAQEVLELRGDAHEVVSMLATCSFIPICASDLSTVDPDTDVPTRLISHTGPADLRGSQWARAMGLDMLTVYNDA